MAWLHADPATDAAKPDTVELIVDFNDGIEKRFTKIPWKARMTVLDAMHAAKASKHGIDFKYKGQGATAFLLQIDDVQNQGSGAGKKNWLFWVNGALADRSFGVYPLEASDSVLWRFDERETGKR